jgi:hypothetical protein
MAWNALKSTLFGRLCTKQAIESVDVTQEMSQVLIYHKNKAFMLQYAS